jgi:dTDP-glucose 4,6-dehydratase
VGKGERQLGWVPQYRDEDMLIAAYDEYHARKTPGASVASGQVAPAE